MHLFDEPRTAHVSFEGNDNASYNCNIIRHNAKLIHREDGNYFMATATVSTQGQNTPILQQYMKADVRIIVSNKTLWQQVFGYTISEYLLFVFGYILLVSIRFNSKSSKFRKFLLDSYGIFRKLSYLCPRIEAFFAYCKIQKRAEVRSFPYCLKRA